LNKATAVLLNLAHYNIRKFVGSLKKQHNCCHAKHRYLLVANLGCRDTKWRNWTGVAKTNILNYFTSRN